MWTINVSKEVIKLKIDSDLFVANFFNVRRFCYEKRIPSQNLIIDGILFIAPKLRRNCYKIAIFKLNVKESTILI